MEKKIIQVCKTKCDKKPFYAEVKRKTYTFCCEKGFKKSLYDFANSTGHYLKKIIT